MSHNPNTNNKKPNRLISEKSPYLLQHAYNPVDWYPWGDEAFERAKAENKPVFVSIGYSSCHWCHVMEKESFEDSQVAHLMNDAFVCIKVDREERPDIDAVYMAVCQAMGKNCGWPLNVILTPNKKPFFVASYIPKDNRYGAYGMIDLVPQIKVVYEKQHLEMEARGTELQERISTLPQPAPMESEIGKIELDEAYDQLYLAFDHENGGFGVQPKFPTPHNLMFLMRYYQQTKQEGAWTMVERTLRAMRLGGIFDQVGLGFHRYSTDSRWLVPHFEKMLYDQAMLCLAYVEAYQFSGQLKFKVTSKETLDYILRDLTSPEGCFYSAEDADSEGEEGKFYLWTQEDLQEVLPPELFEFAKELYGVRPLGNYFVQDKGREGKNILHIAVPIEEMASKHNWTVDQVIWKMSQTVKLLFEARKNRVRPLLDDKVLVDWNGLTIAALAKAAQTFGEQKYLLAAEKAADFILSELRKDDGGLYHRYAKQEKAIDAFLDDYAYLIYGLIELYEAGLDEIYLQEAIALTKRMIENFWDTKNGGFYLSASAQETLPQMKQTHDGAIPSGNSVALHDLLRLSRLSGEVKFEEYANKLLRAVSEEVKAYPMGHTFLLSGLYLSMGPSYTVVLAGGIHEEDTQTMLAELRKRFMPNVTVQLWTPENAQAKPMATNYERIGGKSTAYVCKNQMCMPPTNDASKMLEYLDAK